MSIDDDTPAPVSGSLSARFNQRGEQIKEQQTERFPIPGYQGIVEVELRALGYETVKKVINRNRRIRDEGRRELYSLADQLVTATVGFHEVNGDTSKPIDEDWMDLARYLEDCPDELTPRRAILHILTDKRLPFLVQEWGEWAKSVNADTDEELARDFA